jgi:uncharacterized protein
MVALPRRGGRDDVNDREIKRLGKPFTFKSVGDEAGTIEGYGAVFDDPHPTSSWALPPDFQDIFRPGAFKKTLSDHKSRGISPAMLLEHDRLSLPIGAWNLVEEDSDGLHVKGILATKTARGAEVHELAKLGALSGLSIGFRPDKFKVDEKAKTRELLVIELFEISPVTFPGNDSARISDVKSADPALTKRRIEDALRDAGLSRTEAKALLAEGFKALSGLRDADPEVPEEIKRLMQENLNLMRAAARGA